ncbi:MAG: GntR family transcriptional regulator [Clostridia bacterium]|nr:GntR family transcriptional regulator [Clostridia bacterium]
MRVSETPPVYSRVALDIATRIARGDFREGQKISGRSLTSSEYSVSPETVRRAFRLLSDMDIVDVRQNSGAIVLSKLNAAEYIKKFEARKDMRILKKQLRDLVAERDILNERILDISNQIVDMHERFFMTDPLRSFEFEIPEGSPLLGKTIADSMFWQNTGATIVAIRRDNKIILSPGPYAVFMQHDVVIVSGEIDISDRVLAMVNPKK